MSIEPSGFFDRRHAATDRAAIVVVPPRRLFAIDGVGTPSAAGFQIAAASLRAVAENLRRRLRARGVDEPRAVIECAWWTHPELSFPELAEAFEDRSTWHWQQMIEIPARASDEEAASAIDEARRSAGRAAPLVHIVELTEGPAAQILHVGRAEEESAAVRKLWGLVQEAGLQPRGHLHELLLVEPRQARDGRGRSILRLPVEPQA